MSAELSKLIDYDLWANGLWLEWLQARGFPEPYTAIFRHSVAAQQLWLLRCQGGSPTEMPEPDCTHEQLQELGALWQTELTSPGRIIDYRRLGGEPMHTQRDDIVRHVVNHGTYHRGELRGLCRAQNMLDFPETDYIYVCR